MSNSIPTQAILLAAGRGTRLRPHTDTTPKPLLPIDGRPTLDLLLESLKTACIKEVCAVTHYLEEQIDDYLKQQTWINKTSTAHQQTMNGTATAVLAGLTRDNKNSILVSATDYLVDTNFYHDFSQFHASHNCDISISLKAVPEAERSKRSSVRFDVNNNITEVVEKPASGTAPSAFSANLLFILPAGFRRYLLEVEESKRGEFEVQDAINQFLREGGTARGLVQAVPDEWSVDLVR